MIHVDIEDASDFAVRWLEGGFVVEGTHDGVETKAAHRDIEGRQCTEHGDLIASEADFLFCFTERSLHEGLPGIHDPAWKRHLAAMPHSVGADSKDGMGGVGSPAAGCRPGSGRGEYEDQPGGLAGLRRVESSRPRAARPRGQRQVSLLPREGGRQACLEARDGFIEPQCDSGHGFGTIVIGPHELCGMGYELEVMARTSSDAMNA